MSPVELLPLVCALLALFLTGGLRFTQRGYLRKVVKAVYARGRALTCASYRKLFAWRRFILPWAVATLLIGLAAWHEDQAILTAIHLDDPQAEWIAQFCSKWGDYQTYSIPLALTIWAWGCWVKTPERRRHWRRVAMVCFLGASLTGLFNDFFRLSLGRPRPYALDDKAHVLEDRFYGPRFTWYGQYQSFPSGHAATSFGTGAALLMIEPPLGVVTTAYAAAICWGRMDLRRHYPSDIAVGAMIGIFGGLCIGNAARVRKIR